MIVVIGALLVTAMLPGCGSSGSESNEGNSRPNLVFVVLDDLDTMAPYWDAMAETRKLIADRGLRFTNAFATNPVCCPARATILSGQYPHNTGVFNAAETNVTPGSSDPETHTGVEIFSNDAEKQSVAVRLQAAGYQTAFLGKYLNGYELAPNYVPPGWDEWFGLGGDFLDGFTYSANHNGVRESYGDAEDDYQTDVLARQAIEFVEEAESDDEDPMFLTIWPSAPHGPLEPAPRHDDNQFADDDLPMRPNFDEKDVSDKPRWLREGVAPLDRPTTENELALYRNGLGSLLAVDEMIAELADVLRENDEFDNTVFVLTSDNGLNRGAHRLDQKMAPYDESIRVPLAIAGPGVRHGTEDRIATHVDFAPTLFELAAMEVADDLDGRSLVPLLRGEDAPWRTDFLVEFRGLYSPLFELHSADDIADALDRGGVRFVPTYRAVRSEDHLYVEWYAGDVHEYELYDLNVDPYQLMNLLATPELAAEHATTAATLQMRLDELAACTGVSCR